MIIITLQNGQTLHVGTDWLTIAAYCTAYGEKMENVLSWIRREKIPAEDQVIVEELNNLKLIRNRPYK